MLYCLNRPFMKAIKKIIILFITLGLFYACSKDSSDPKPQNSNQSNQPADNPSDTNEPEPDGVVIGQEGGEVVSDDGLLILKIPEGALKNQTTIKINVVSNSLPIENSEVSQIGKVYSLSPSDLTFDFPVEIEMSGIELENNNLETFCAITWDSETNSKNKPYEEKKAEVDFVPILLNKPKLINEVISASTCILKKKYALTDWRQLIFKKFDIGEYADYPWRVFNYRWNIPIIKWYVSDSRPQESLLTTDNIQTALNLWQAETNSFEFVRTTQIEEANIIFEEVMDDEGLEEPFCDTKCSNLFYAWHDGDSESAYGRVCPDISYVDFLEGFQNLEDSHQMRILIASKNILEIGSGNTIYNTQKVLSHEIGHALGIGHVNPDHWYCSYVIMLGKDEDGEYECELANFIPIGLDEWDVFALYEHYEAANGSENDSDNDGILNNEDNCPEIPNPNQSNNDDDELGDICDPDDDNDGVDDTEDKCPFDEDPNQEDFDNDGIGDACDDDVDGDGVLNENDQCPNTQLGIEVDENGCEVQQGNLLVSTLGPTNINPSSSILNGEISDDGGLPVTDRGFYISYSESMPPTESQFDDNISLGSGNIGTFSTEYFFPELGVSVYYVAYAKNSNETVIGTVQEARYDAQSPEVVINQPTNGSNFTIGSIINISGYINLIEPNSIIETFEVYIDGQLYNNDISNFDGTNFSLDWDTGNSNPGIYQIFVNATDNLGTLGSSSSSIELIDQGNVDDVYIPDENFELALIDLGLDSGTPDGYVPIENINSITELDLFNRNITDLTGIEEFTELIYLDISQNFIEILDLSNNTNLDDVNASSNQYLSQIQGPYNTELWVFAVSDCPLLDGFELSSILVKNLYAEDCDLGNVKLNSSVLQAFLVNSQISSLDLSEAQTLNNLDARENNLEQLDISQAIDLANLDLQSNNLSCIMANESQINGSWNFLRLDEGVIFSLDCNY